ncbi:MAG: UDP-3-O-acyl-N-acetylglucosamine deacetylase [Alphaproteobacteria bacterium]|nr:UDP-3-O-acyl-N-acetylglucosamine deacetylase [Alphaproteobacteria bacterium]
MSYEPFLDDQGLKNTVPPALGGAGETFALQQTLAREVACSGVGVHSGQTVHMRLCPASENTGIVFIRTDLVNGARTVNARWDNVVDTRLCTVIGNDHGGRVATVEHLMAALFACGVDNARIEIDGGEVPVMDGSADVFVGLLDEAGLARQKAPRRVIDILAPVDIVCEGRRVSLSPAAEPRYSVTIDFDSAPIKRQRYDMVLSPDAFRDEISRARTFGFFEQVDQLKKMGLAQGGSLENSIIIKDGRVLNEDGLRYEDEFVRHKLLDAIGDLALAGAVLRGHFEGACCGHALNNRLLRALFSKPDAWRIAEDGFWGLHAAVA